MKNAWGDDVEESAAPTVNEWGDPVDQTQPASGGALAFVGRQLQRVPAAIRGSIEGLQDMESPLGPTRKAIQGFKDPNSVQTFGKAFERMGVPNQPSPAMKQNRLGRWEPGIPDAERQQDGRNPDGSIRFKGQGQRQNMGAADALGTLADVAAPTGLEILPAAKLAQVMTKATAGKLAPKAQAAANRIQQTVLRPRAGDWNSGAKIENIPKYGIQGGVDEVIQGADDQIKTASANLRQAIQSGADEGASVDLYAAIDRAKAKLAKEGKADLVDAMGPAFAKFRRWAGVEAQRGTRGVGEADLMSGQEFKQMMGTHGAWEKTAAAKNMGISQGEKYQSQAAQAVYLELKEAIEAAAPEGVRELNKTLSDLIPIRNAAVYRKIVADRNNPIGISDMMSAMTAVGNGGAGAAMLAATRFTKSGLGAKTMYSVANSLRKLSGARNASEATFYIDKLKAAEMSKAEIADALQEIRRPLDLNSAPAGRNVPNLKNARRPLPLQFGQAKPGTKEFDPLDMLMDEPGKGAAAGAPGFDGMAPPALEAQKAASLRETAEAVARQDRPARTPSQQQAPGGVQILSNTDVKLPPRQPRGNPESNFPPTIPEDPRVAQVLDGTGRRPLPAISDDAFLQVLNDAKGWPPGLNQQKIEFLVRAYKHTKPTQEKAKIMSRLRAEFLKADEASKARGSR